MYNEIVNEIIVTPNKKENSIKKGKKGELVSARFSIKPCVKKEIEYPTNRSGLCNFIKKRSRKQNKNVSVTQSLDKKGRSMASKMIDFFNCLLTQN